MEYLQSFNATFSRFVKCLPVIIPDTLAARPTVKICFNVIVLLLTFLLFEKVVSRVATLAHDSYAENSLLYGLVAKNGLLTLLIISCLLAICMRYGSLLSRWDKLQQGQKIRYFVVFLGFLIAWPLCTLAYNYFFNQGYYFERVSIVGLLVLLWWRPVFIFPFIIMVYVLLMQLKQPDLGGSILAHKLQVMHVLNLFAAAFLIHAISGYRKMRTFVFMCCCLVASAYWLPALSKFNLGWLSLGSLHHGTLAAYAHGWLGFLSPDEVIAFAQTLAWFERPMHFAVLILEGACLFFLITRKATLILLIGVVVFHIGVFVLIGFLFWTWMLLDLALLLLLFNDYRNKNWPIYSKPYLLLSFILIGFGAFWAKPPALAWFDTRLTYTYKIDAITEQGSRYTLAPDFFAPYDDIFTMASFSYLVSEHHVLVGPYGVTQDAKIAAALASPVSAAEIFKLENEMKKDKYNPVRAEAFYDFILRFVANYNSKTSMGFALNWLSPPRQFWSFIANSNPHQHNKITKLIVSELTTLYDDNSLKVIREYEIKQLDILEYESNLSERITNHKLY
jgi:hypothetical protein